MLRTLSFTLAHFVFLAASAYSQTVVARPDFSGDWRLNLADSKVTKGTDPDAFVLSANTILRIVHSEPEFTPSTIRPDTGAVVSSSTYYTDGREKSTESGLSIAKTKWEGKKLITQIKPSVKDPESVGSRRPDGTIAIGAGTIKREIRFEWELLANGQLVQKVRITDRSEMQIMNRREVKEDKTEIVKVFDLVKPS